MRKAFLFFAVVLSLGLGAVAATESAAVPAQALDVSYDAERQELSGTLVTTVPAARSVYFLLLPNLDRERNPHLTARGVDARYPFGFEESALDIGRVALVDGETRRDVRFRLLAMPPAWQTYSLSDAILAIDDIQTASTVEIAFTTRLPRAAGGDGAITDGVVTTRFGWFPLFIEPSAELREADGTLYSGDGDAFPLVFPLAQISARIALPADLVLTAGADRIVRAPATDEADEVVYTIENSGPTRSLALTFEQDVERYVLDGPTPIEVTYRKDHVYEARLLATYAREILADFSARYGRYPRERFSIVENPNDKGDAFSADGIALLSARFFTHRDLLVPAVFHRLTEFVLAHEIAHQWFGMGTGVDLDRDGWLSEGLAQYAAVEYFERVYGAQEPNLLFVGGAGLLENFVDKQFGYLNLREHMIEIAYTRDVWSGFDEALAKPATDLEYANANVVRLYDKGYIVARALAAAAGADAFERVLRRAIRDGAAHRVTSADLQRWVEEETGRSFATWFAAWVTGDATVDYSVRIVERVQTGSTHETIVRVGRAGGVPQDVEVEARLDSGATTRLVWDGAGDEGELVFRTPSPVSRVTIDPEHRLPDRDRLNNNAPVRIVVAADKNVAPLDAFVLAPDASSSGVSFSRLDRFRLTVSQNEASLVVRRGRGELVQAAVSVSGTGWAAGAGYAVTAFERVTNGTPGTTWEPGFAFSVSGHRLESDGRPLYVARFAGRDLATSAESTEAAVRLDVASTGAVRVAAIAAGELGLLPQAYAQTTAFLGYGFGSLPSALRFAFDELHAARLPEADAKLSGTLALELPSIGATPYRLAGLAMLDRLRLRVYVTGAAGWTSQNGFGTTSIGAEAGMEQVFSLSTLGGFMPFTARLGVAVPLVGKLEPVLYAGFSL